MGLPGSLTQPAHLRSRQPLKRRNEAVTVLLRKFVEKRLLDSGDHRLGRCQYLLALGGQGDLVGASISPRAAAPYQSSSEELLMISAVVLRSIPVAFTSAVWLAPGHPASARRIATCRGVTPLP